MSRGLGGLGVQYVLMTNQIALFKVTSHRRLS